MRETIDRLPAPSCQGAALKELAKLQISHFGGLDEVGRLVAKQSTMVPILSEPGVLGEDFGEDEDDFGKDEGEAGEKEEHGDTANQAPRQAAISQNNQLEPVLEKLKSIRFSHLRSRPAQAPSGVKEMGMPARNVEKTTTYNDCTDSFDELCDSIRKDVHHGLRTNIKKAPEADTSEHCSSLLLALPLWSGQRDRARASQMLEHQLTFAIFADASSVQEGGLQLEPRIALFSNEYIREMLTLSRLLDVASGQSRSQVWGRNGGKTLLLTPCVAAAISLLRGLAFLLPNVTADTPFGLPGGDGTSALGSSMAGSFSSMVLSGGAPGALGDGPTELAEVLLPDDLRGWLKERLMHAVTDDASAILILPPSVIDHPELLAVLHEAFSLAGPPDGWFSEKEIRDCEAAVESLEPTQRLLPPTMYQEDENNHVLPWMDQFWAEALGRTHFVFLARALYEEGRLPLRCHVTTELLDTQYPGFLQQMAVVQMEHLSRETFVSAAKAHLSSPVLEPESWQPDTPLKAVISTDALSEAATSLIEAVRRIAADPPPGFAPKNFRQPPDLSRRPGPTAGDCENSIPKIGQNCSGWSGEGTDSGLGAREASIADLGDLLALTQNLCGLKGRELAKQHRDLKNAHKLLEELQKDLVNTSAEEVERQLAEITDRSQKAKELADLKKQEYNNRKASLAELVSEVIDRCSQARTKYGAAETLCQETSRELEMNRMQLISFSKVDQAELRNLLKQHLPAGDLTPRSPTVALFEMCAIALRVSAKPSRDAARTAMSNPLFTTKLAGVDTDALTAEHIEGMSESLSIAGGPADFADTKSLFMIANVVFPAYHMAATKLKLPAMQKELDRLLEIRVKRTVEVEDMQDQVNDLADESKDLQQRSQNLQKEVAKQHQVVGANKERRERMEKLSGLTRHDRWRWSWLIDDLSDRLEDLVGDCLLSAAAALFMGPLGPDHRQQLLGHWKDCLEQLGVQHSHKFDICWYWVPATARSRWRSELGVPPDRHLEESLVLSTLQAVSWPLFYDPDGIAVNILLQFYPGATSISMGTPDFRDKLLHAIQTSATFEKNAKQAPGEAPGAAGGPRKPDVADPLVVIIDNTYLPALREIDLLTELLPRKQLRAAACATKGAAIPLMYFSGEENTVQVDPKLVLLFVTRSAEPLARDLLSYQFQVIDFRVCVEAESQVSQEMLSALIFRRTQPTVHAEWKQLQPERAALIDEWARLDEDVIAKLGAHLKAKQKDKHDSYPTGEHVRDMMTLKATANDVGRRLLKSKDAEAKLLQARTPHEPLAVMLASLASACQDLRWICPSLNISFGSFLNLVEESLPPLPAENTRSARDKKAEVTDLDWGVIARQAVVSALSRHCQAAVPENLVLPVAVRIAVAASIPNKGLQEIISKLLLQCPASDLACLGVELSKQTHQAIEALLDGEPVSRVVKFLDQLPARKFSRERMGSGSPCGDQDQLFPPSPSRTLRRAMTSKLGSPNSSRDALEEWNSGHDVETRERGFKHGKTRSVGQTLAPPTMLASSPHGSRTPSRNSLQETASLQRSRSPSPSPSVASHYENCDALSEVAVLPRRTGLLRTSQTSVNLGQSSQDDGKEPEVKLQYSSPTLMRQLFVSADHWEPCSTKPVFLARFCYFQDALRLLLHKAAGNSHNFGYSTGTAAAAALALFPVQDLFRMSRVENFAKLPSDFDIMEKSFGIQRMNTGELSLSMNSRRDSRSHQGNPGQGILRRDSRLFKPALGEKEGVGDEQAKKTRTADAGGEHEEGAGDNSTDVLQVLSIMGQFTALGGLRNPVLSVEVDWVFLRGTIDRLLESVGADADKWACWADNVARGELKAEPKEPGSASTAFGTGLGNWGTGPMEQLPLLTSVPLDLLTAFLPLTTNGFPTLTLQQTSALNVVQVLLLLVLLSHSLVALLAGLEAISGELAPSRGASHLEALLNHSSPLQPVVCLCESAASSVQDTIVALASQQKGGRKVVHVALTGVVINPWASNQSTQGIGWSGVGPVAAAARPMSQIAELLEESLEEGQWLVLSLLPGGAPGLYPSTL